MGFKDAGWAYSLDLPTSQKVILAAIAHATDDSTHQTYVSQKTLAGMVGMSVATVNVSVRALDESGIITRQRRSGLGGYRTTDIITVNTAYVGQTNVGVTNIGDTYVGETGDLHQSDAPPTSTSLIAEEIIQIDQPDDQPVKELVQPEPAHSIEDDFAEFWSLYPRKQAKNDAVRAYKIARKTVDAKIIHDGAQAYALLHIGDDKNFLKLPGGWLRDGRWGDEQIPPSDRSSLGGRKLTRSEQNLAFVVEHAVQEAVECPQHPGYPLEPTCAKCDREVEGGRVF